jgi:hypothetical protein
MAAMLLGREHRRQGRSHDSTNDQKKGPAVARRPLRKPATAEAVAEVAQNFADMRR